MLRVLRNSLVISIIMLTVLFIVSHAHANALDNCFDCHKKQREIILEKTDSIIYKGAKFNMKRILGDQTLSVYILSINSKHYILNSKGGIIEYR